MNIMLKKWRFASAFAVILCFAAASAAILRQSSTRKSAANTVATTSVHNVVSTITAAATSAVGGSTAAVTAATTATSAAVVPALADGVMQLAPIASNFDVGSELVPAWGSGGLPASAAPDVVGAFRFICNASHLSYNDPIVYPGQPGASHLHQFFGNTKADANSTYASLRTTGDSTCTSKLNRSAYWMPAMLDGAGGVVVPDYVSIYYKRLPASDPACKTQGIACVNIPRGLKFVFGYNMLNAQAAPTGEAYFNCDGPTAKPGVYPDIVTAAANCPMGNRLGAVISAPDCWDGRNLDSPDHRSHVAYAGYGDWGYLKCPSTHPYVIPTFTMGVWYTTDARLNRSGTFNPAVPTWHLSSDEMPGTPMKRPGSTFHADWFGAWDDTVLAMWSDNCISKLLNCSGGDLGNGKQMKMYAGYLGGIAARGTAPRPLAAGRRCPGRIIQSGARAGRLKRPALTCNRNARKMASLRR